MFEESEAAELSEKEVLALIFHAGFSTAAVVSNISGRGVGMDVVRNNIEGVGGSVEVESTLGSGSVFRIKIPLTLAIAKVFVVRCGSTLFAIPQTSVNEVIQLEAGSSHGGIEDFHGASVLRHRNRLLPIVHLDETLDLSEPPEYGAESCLVVIGAGDSDYAVLVDEVVDTPEVVVRPLGPHLSTSRLYAGATILGDGNVTLVLDGVGLGFTSGVLSRGAASPAQKRKKCPPIRRLLLVREDSLRFAFPLDGETRLVEVAGTAFTQRAGQVLLRRSDRILRVFSLRSLFGGVSLPPDERALTQVVLYGRGASSVGFMVDEILDVIEEPDVGEVLGDRVVEDHVTRIVDLAVLSRRARELIEPDLARPGMSCPSEGGRKAC